MHNRTFTWLFVIVFLRCLSSTTAGAAQSTSGGEYTGTWSGTWDGSGSGNFELTLEKAKDGGTAGKVAVTTEQGNYTADLKSVSFAGNKMTATYDFPLDASAEVALAATFEAAKAAGTWSLRPKGGGAELVGGSFTVSKK
jgi:hypothetical protein